MKYIQWFLVYSMIGGALIGWGYRLNAEKCGRPAPYNGDMRTVADIMGAPAMLPSMLVLLVVAGDKMEMPPCR